MKHKKNSVLDKFTLEELVKMLDEECNAMGIPCIKNGHSTEFERLSPPTLDECDILDDWEESETYSETYTVPASTMIPSKGRSYFSMTTQNTASLPSWNSLPSAVACSISSNLKLAA